MIETKTCATNHVIIDEFVDLAVLGVGELNGEDVTLSGNARDTGVDDRIFLLKKCIQEGQIDAAHITRKVGARRFPQQLGADQVNRLRERKQQAGGFEC